MRFASICVIGVVTGACTITLSGKGVPAGYILPDFTLSPDHRYGITVPTIASQEQGTVASPQNDLIEVKTGKRLGVIQADAAFDRMNEAEIVIPWWAADDSSVLWQVDGEWGFNAEILVTMENGTITRQINILQLLQQEMLKRTCQANPKKYAEVKKASTGYGSWFHDGFAIDCVLVPLGGSLRFPLHYHCFLTSNTKSIESIVTINSRMNAHVNEDGSFKVDAFYLGDEPPARDFVRPSMLPSP